MSFVRYFGTRELLEALRLWSDLGLIMQLVFDVASGVYGLAISWYSPFLWWWLCPCRSRHPLVWRCLSSRDSVWCYNIRRRPRSVVQDRLADSNFQIKHGFSWFDASVRFYPEFGNGTAHREHGPFSVLPTNWPDRQRCNMIRYRWAGEAYVEQRLDRSQMPLKPIRLYTWHLWHAWSCIASERWCSGCNHPKSWKNNTNPIR